MRRLLKVLSQFLVWLCTRPEVHGLENFPKQGPVLIVINHLGDVDAFLGLAIAPVCVDTIAKQELYDVPIIGVLMHAYGMIWLQRGVAYRHVLRAALDGLAEGRFVSIAPEGRESLTGALEQGMDGAAYLALKSDALLLPVTFTGTENRRIFDNLKRLRRTAVTATIGKPFRLENTGNWRKDITRGTLKIMDTLASQLPSEYRGVYPIRRNESISSFFRRMSIIELTGLRCSYESYYWMLTEKEAQGLPGNQTRVKTKQ